MKRRRVLRNEDAYEDWSKGQSWDASRAHAGRQSNIVINRSRPMDRSRYTNPGDREIYLMNCSHNYHDLRRVGGSEKHESLGRSANLSSANPSLWPPAPPPSPFLSPCCCRGGQLAHTPPERPITITTTNHFSARRLAGRNLGNSYVDRETIIIFPGYAACSE